jgi:hypothetical protein
MTADLKGRPTIHAGSAQDRSGALEPRNYSVRLKNPHNAIPSIHLNGVTPVL